MIRELQQNLAQGYELGPEEIEHAVEALTSSHVEEEAKADFLRSLRAKGETAQEIASFAEAMLRRAVDPGLEATQLPGPMIDVCGTGGDRAELFNVSTTSMFVVAAAGAIVVKHGNRAVTSQCGGADVLQELGIRLELPPAQLRETVERVGAGFIFAPAYHPAIKAIMPVRKRLAAEGHATVFNLLGPLLNPARPAQQIVGVYAAELLPRYAGALAHLGRARAWVVNGNGLDELSTTGANQVEERFGIYARAFTFDPAQYGFAPASPEDLRGGGCTRNAELLVAILDGTETGPRRDIVVLNSGAALFVAGVAADLPTGFAMAEEQLRNGQALARLHAMRDVTTALAAA